MKYKILVLMPLDEQQKNEFRTKAQNMDIDFCPEDSVNSARIADVDIIVGNPPPSLLKHAKKLKWLQLITAGADKYQQLGVLNEHVLLTCANGAYGEAQSEFMLAMLLSLYKNLHIYRDHQNECLWQNEGCERMLCDSTALIIGMGDIGTHFAKRLKAFGVYVIGVRRSNLRPSEYADELYTVDRLNELLPKADIVSMTIPATPETRHMMNKKTLSLIKPGAVLINAGRGITVDTDALCDALEQKKLSGAALDVTEIEPLPQSHKLWHMRNVIITPHVAGQDYLPLTMEKTIAIALYNINAFLSGKPLQNIVSFDPPQ